MLRRLALSGAILGVGFGLGYALKPAPSTSIPQKSAELDGLKKEHEQLQDLKGKLAQLSEKDLEDYLRLKNLEQKYKKADELIGKMILILLTDLGIRVSDGQERFAKAVVLEKPLFPAQPVPPAVNSPSQVAGAQATSPASSTTPASWVKAEEKLSGLRDAQEIDSFLKETRIGDFFGQLGQSTLMKKIEPRTTGCFEGEVQLQDGSNKTWEMRLEALFNEGGQAVQGAKSLSGKSLIALSENGKVFSRSSSDGEMKAFRKFSNSSSALLLAASESIYFQLYFVPDRDMYVGNMYKKVNLSKFDFMGTTYLSRAKGCS